VPTEFDARGLAAVLRAFAVSAALGLRAGTGTCDRNRVRWEYMDLDKFATYRGGLT
jgi:hypothetical protein